MVKKSQADSHEGLKKEYSGAEAKRDELLSTFEDAIKQIQHKSDFHNIVLEQRLGAASVSFLWRLSVLSDLGQRRNSR